VAVDSTNNEIYVSNWGSNIITIYNRTDSGNVAPKRTIAGSSTGLNGPGGIVIVP